MTSFLFVKVKNALSDSATYERRRRVSQIPYVASHKLQIPYVASHKLQSDCVPF